MTGIAVVALAVAFATLRQRSVPTPSTPPAQAPRGAQVYERLGCPACHALRGSGHPANPLDGVGQRLSPDKIRTWIVAPQRMKPGVRKPTYDHVPQEDVAAVVDYLRGS
jgi:cytochrome c oxidase subunit 2